MHVCLRWRETCIVLHIHLMASLFIRFPLLKFMCKIASTSCLKTLWLAELYSSDENVTFLVFVLALTFSTKACTLTLTGDS